MLYWYENWAFWALFFNFLPLFKTWRISAKLINLKTLLYYVFDLILFSGFFPVFTATQGVAKRLASTGFLAKKCGQAEGAQGTGSDRRGPRRLSRQ